MKGEYRVIKSEYRVIKSEYRVMKSLLSVYNRVVKQTKNQFLTFFWGAQKNRLIETVFLSIHSICFGRDSNIVWMLKGPYQ